MNKLAAICMYAVKNTSNTCIDYKLLEPRHTQMEVHSMHSVTDNTKKSIHVYTHSDWTVLVQMARWKPQSFTVHAMSTKYFYNFDDAKKHYKLTTFKDKNGVGLTGLN